VAVSPAEEAVAVLPVAAEVTVSDLSYCR